MSVSALLIALLLGASASQPSEAKLLNGQGMVTADDYPIASLRGEEQGSVEVKLTVDESGLVTECTVVRSSGHRALDAQTCAIYRARAQFEPAKDEAGKPVQSEVTQKLTWKIGDPLLMPRSEWMMRMIVGLTSNGEIISCRMESAGIGTDASDCRAPGQRRDLVGEPSGYAISETHFYPVDPESAPTAPELQGALLASRQVSRVTISPDGQVIACEPIAFSGAAPSHSDKCLMLTSMRFQGLPEGSSPTVGTLVHTDYVQGTAASSNPTTASGGAPLPHS